MGRRRGCLPLGCIGPWIASSTGVARRITGRQPRRRGDGSWAYLILEEAMGEAGSEGIRKSVTRRQNTFAQYIPTRPNLDLCERSNWRPGLRVSRWWWEQAGIDL